MADSPTGDIMVDCYIRLDGAVFPLDSHVELVHLILL
jgi:hypothetical protein